MQVARTGPRPCWPGCVERSRLASAATQSHMTSRAHFIPFDREQCGHRPRWTVCPALARHSPRALDPRFAGAGTPVGELHPGTGDLGHDLHEIAPHGPVVCHRSSIWPGVGTAPSMSDIAAVWILSRSRAPTERSPIDLSGIEIHAVTQAGLADPRPIRRFDTEAGQITEQVRVPIAPSVLVRFGNFIR